MQNRKIEVGDKVALSATFLRSIDPSANKGWPTRFDRGVGTVVSLEYGWLVEVSFSDGVWRGNVCNLVHTKDIYNESMRAEHHRRRYD